MKKILFIKDPEMEVGFDVLCNYCATVQERVGNEIIVLPIWPHGEADIIGDKRKLKLIIKELREVLDDLDIEFNT